MAISDKKVIYIKKDFHENLVAYCRENHISMLGFVQCCIEIFVMEGTYYGTGKLDLEALKTDYPDRKNKFQEVKENFLVLMGYFEELTIQKIQVEILLKDSSFLSIDKSGLITVLKWMYYAELVEEIPGGILLNIFDLEILGDFSEMLEACEIRREINQKKVDMGLGGAFGMDIVLTNTMGLDSRRVQGIIRRVCKYRSENDGRVPHLGIEKYIQEFLSAV